MSAAPLRIGITCFPLVGGSGILATALGSELAARGHEVHFFSYARPVRLDLSAPRIHFHEVAVSENSLFPCPDYTLPLAVRMADVARSVGLDVLHSHYAVPHAVAAFLAAEMLGKLAPKLITTLHGTDTNLLGTDPAYRPAIEHALNHSNAVTTVSESLCAQTTATFRLSRSISVIPNFFVPVAPTRSREAVRRELGISNEFLVVHMSNLRSVKRIDLLLRAFAAAKDRQSMRLLILAGEPFAPNESLARDLGIRDQLIVNEKPVAIEDYLQAADAGLYTSEVESFGLSILETMFFAKPVVAFRIGGIPEVVGDAGCLESFGDVRALSAALDSLVDSPEKARDLGRRAAERARTRFSAAKIVPLYETLYRRVLA